MSIVMTSFISSLTASLIGTLCIRHVFKIEEIVFESH